MADQDPPALPELPGGVHPLATYLTNQRAARVQVDTELFRQQGIATNGATSDERTQAERDGTALSVESAHMEAEHQVFLVQVFTLGRDAMGPATQTVAETMQLNKDLATVVMDANRARTYVNLITEYLNGAISVVNGMVPAPTPPAPSPTPAP